MNAWKNLRYYWRQHVLVLIGLCLASAVCMASLSLGKSAEQQLKSQIYERMGSIHNGIVLNGRFVQSSLVERVSQKLPSASAVLTLRSLVSAPSKQTRHPRVLIHGIDNRFHKFAPVPAGPLANLEGLAINEILASHLNVALGDELIVRVEKPSLMSKDAPLSPDDEHLVSLRLPIEHILSVESFGSFQLSSSPDPSMNVFVPLNLLQETVELRGSINQIYFDNTADLAVIQSSVDQEWSLSDCGIQVQANQSGSELTSDRIFIDAFITDASPDGTQSVLGYMVNEIAHAERKTPYSIMAALDDEMLAQMLPDAKSEIPENGIIINQWLAEDLQASVGDSIDLGYYELQKNNELVQRQEQFVVSDVVPIDGLAADRSLMPKFPGLAEKDDCREWDPGAQVDLAEIREKDEQYWDEYRGTPKAFIRLKAGQRMWGNRFGAVTALRSNQSSEALRAHVRSNVHSKDFGLQVISLMDHAESAASRGARYVSSVFVGLHTFVIIAALLLVYLFYDIALQHRRKEIGLLRAQGFAWSSIKKVFQQEHLLLMLLMILPACLLAYLYDLFLLSQLGTHWSAAVADTELDVVFSLSSYFIGAAMIILISWLLLRLLLRPLRVEPSQRLLRGEVASSGAQADASPLIPFCSMLLSIGLAVMALLYLPLAENDPMRYFACACLFMIAGLCGFSAFNRYVLLQLPLSNARILVLRNMAMHARRHVFLLSLFAICVFLVIGSSAFKSSSSQIDLSRGGPSGGFSYFGQVSVPLDADLNTAVGRDQFAIDAEQMDGVHVVQMRANNDEETSCLNLNQSTKPRIWGLDPAYLTENKAFPFMQSAAHDGSPWSLLSEKREGRIPVIGDVNSILWSMGRGLGSVFTYTDEFGEEHELEVVALLQDSLLQGALVMDEQYFSELFPSISGYHYFMLDVAASRAEQSAADLERSLQRHGLVLESSVDRIQRYADVRNTYIQIFQAIGVLGIALGSVGLAAIVIRHIIERRSQLAVMRAYGFKQSSLNRQVFWEHMSIVLIGLFIGIISGLLVILPMSSSWSALMNSLGPLAVVLIVAATSCFIAARIGMRGQIDQALRGD